MPANLNDLSIFTNKNENGIKLADRLNTVLTNSKYFDVLVGYFRITGFYLLKEQLKDVEKIRILIGLGTDLETVKAVDIFELSGANAVRKVQEVVKEEFNSTTNDNLEMENGIITFCEWIKSGKLEIRMCFEQNVHAKLYIVRKNPEVVPDQFGNLITGSSNFSYNGLEKNIEFNVELKDQNNVQYALDFFDELWSSSKDITEDILTTINTETWMNHDITPYELFLKTLFVYFEEEIQTRQQNLEWPDGYMSLQYQEDAVTQARKILAKHGGVIISDVVGLGKTYISAMLGKLLDGRKLFIVPPVVKDNWESVLADFGYKMSDKVVSLGIVDQVAEWDDLASYKYIFVDEAHRFRNSTSTEFQKLKKICYGKGVILITATPQNNTILDIANLITLFQDSRNSSVIPGTKNLEKFFNDRHKEVRASGNDKEVVSQIASEIRDNVLRHVLIRRTRREISEFYKEDLDKQGLKFPKVNDPIRMDYMYNPAMEEAFNDTIELLKNFSYARYAPLLYLKDQSRVGSDKARQQNMVGFVKTMLVKRLESSIFAFKESIKRLIESSEGFIQLYDSGKVVFGSASHTKYSFSDFYNMTEDAFKVVVEANDIEYFEPDEFEDNFIDKVKNDDAILKKIYNIWSQFDLDTDDSKYDLLKTEIDKLDKSAKIIIFSEAKDTVTYLTDKLTKDYGNVVVDFSGSDNMKKKQYIQDNFDPKFDRKGINDKRILVTTDTLSEGINLHKAYVIFNYDLPWNPTRIMQRVGRINRVGSKNEELFVYNFFPRANAREHLSLEDAIKAKIQMFNELLGEDSKTITEEENIQSYNLYDFLMMANKLDDEADLMSNGKQMSYLKIVNDIMINNPKLAEQIQNLPDKIRVARNHDKNSVITFIKQGWIKKFIQCTNSQSKEIEFEEAMSFLEADEDTVRIEIPENYFECLSLNKTHFENLIDDNISQNILQTASPAEKKVKLILKAMLNSNELNTHDQEFLLKVDEAIKRGSLNSRTMRDVKKELDKKLSNIKDMVLIFRKHIDEVYLVERKNYDVQNSLAKPKIIVLSECLVKE